MSVPGSEAAATGEVMATEKETVWKFLLAGVSNMTAAAGEWGAEVTGGGVGWRCRVEVEGVWWRCSGRCCVEV